MSKDGRNRRMRAFLRKPVSEQALINAIQGALRLRRQDENGRAATLTLATLPEGVFSQ
jgi:FixJ family two-component response regulator